MVSTIENKISLEEYASRSRKYENNSIILNSIRKSGTNYLRLLIANYLTLLNSESTSCVTYSEMHNDIFPNVRDYVLFPEQYETVTARTVYRPLHYNHILKKVGFDDFLYGHDDYEYLTMSCARKIIHLYRNPFDMAVSYYYYAYKNRPERAAARKDDRIGLAVEHLFCYYIKHYVFMRHYASAANNVLRIDYESLYTRPREVLAMLFRWLGFPLHLGHIEQAIVFSSKDQIRQEERMLGAAIHVPKGVAFTGSFVRSGEIGQWKTHFTDIEQNVLIRLLEKHGISLSEFILEP